MTLPLANARFLIGRAIVCLVCVSLCRAQTNTDFDKGTTEFQAGNYVVAAALFARAESASPGTTAALLYQAKCLAQMQDFNGAEGALRRYISSHPDSSDALYMLGFVLNRQNRPSDSLRAYTQAAALTPPAGDDLKIVALDYVLLDDYADATNWLEKAVGRDPKNEDAWYYLGRAYYTKARLGEARKAFETVLTLNPRSSKAENNLGLILETEGQTATAMKAYQTAIAWQEHSSRPSEQPYVNLGNLLMEQGKTKEAIPPLEKAVALAPNNAFCRMTLGMAYRQLGQLDAAQRELEKATQLEPDNAKAHYQLGRLYKDIHDTVRARAEFDKTAELKTRSAGSNPARPKH